MSKFLSLLLIPARWLLLPALVIGACFNQFNFSLTPFWQARQSLFMAEPHTDSARLERLAPDIAALVKAVKAYPVETRFYFAPCFRDSGNTARWWWYVYLLTRYLSYPRKILCHDEVLYKSDKTVYSSRYIGKAARWQDLDWITSRGVQVIIMMRNNAVTFIPVSERIQDL